MTTLTNKQREGLQLLADAGEEGLRRSNATKAGCWLYWQTADALVNTGLARLIEWWRVVITEEGLAHLRWDSDLHKAGG